MVSRRSRIKIVGKLAAREQEEREEQLRELARQLQREQWLAGQAVDLDVCQTAPDEGYGDE